MRFILIVFLALFFSIPGFGQQTDTLTFYSEAFKGERSIFVKTPEQYKYGSESVRLPVIYVLDGQHEWFVNPVLNDIEYLQYTHEMPQAIIVVIPLTDRIQECGIDSLEAILPLHTFITEEINEEIKRYHPGNYRVIVGHSFSASFALYSYLHSPEFYSAVMAHSPYDSFEKLVAAMDKNEEIDKSDIFISIGSPTEVKDYNHREKYNELKAKYPSFFKAVNLFEANDSTHNAVPIAACPSFFTKVFFSFSTRFASIAKVDMEYKLVEKPLTVKEEEEKMLKASMLGDYFYAPEIAEINGMASRYLASGFNYHAIRLHETGIKYYPNYYEFYLSLYELLEPIDLKRARPNLEKAELLLQQMEPRTEDNLKLLQEIKEIRNRKRW
ncbi:hypothetical protein FUA48_02365 [Flavobacterium alkalisoli]|uniref:Esterase n=1 Tax=Flavobacterium alkalisoli TaxID=2602769 RepID=A0A5B9FUQ9_9FLAO|nr:alpha/beta hydrolase-fold protein [Flavobacterium alkalisoli]QEE48457.1 hypothetical protein FUA48_02365 [Flavobacterium alkalisoli]